MRNFTPPNKMMTIDDEKQILELYAKGNSAPQILKVLDKFKTTKTIYDILRKYEVDSRGGDTARDPNLDHFYFSEIDNQKKAYLLGFWLADGWICTGQKKKSDTLSLGLVETDASILETVKSEFNTKCSILRFKSKEFIAPNGKTYTGAPACRITVTSNQMVSNLKQWGVDEEKSCNSYLPLLNGDKMPHLLRGILDGDGTTGVYKYDGKKGYKTIKFNGTPFLVAQISLYLSLQLGVRQIRPSVHTNSKFLASITYTVHDDVIVIRDYLYPPNLEEGFYLERKRNHLED